ncbi:hypothetical protein EDD86DRAFT_277120 [Gorgonomyces haynaldii]|nr:hypothetical protein EDD86DRAFT_277120 [Gorgonomyces haynaldii]
MRDSKTTKSSIQTPQSNVYDNEEAEPPAQEAISFGWSKFYTAVASAIYGKSWIDVFAYIAVIVEDLQLFSFLFDPSMAVVYQVPSAISNGIDSGFSVDDMNITRYGAQVTIAIAYTVLLFLVCLLALRVKAGTKLYNLARFLYRFSVYFFPFRYLSICGLFAAVYRCPTVTDNSMLMRTTSCFNTTRIALSVIAIVSWALITCWHTFLTFVSYDPNPAGKTILHKSSSAVDLFYIFLKLIMACCWYLLPMKFLMGKIIVFLALAAFMYIAYIMAFPYYNITLNKIRAAFYFATFMAGVIALTFTALYSSSGTRLPVICAGVIALVYLISWPIGFYLTGYLFQRKQKRLIESLEKLNEEHYQNNKWYDDDTIFGSWYEVDLACRVGTNEMYGRRKAKKEDIELMKIILRRGKLEFPYSYHLLMLSSLYSYHVFEDKQASFKEMRHLEIRRCFLDTQIYAFSHLELERKQKELAFLRIEGIRDIHLASNAALLLQNTKRHHYYALFLHMSIWKLILDPSFENEKLQDLSQKLYESVTKTMDGYKQLITNFPKSFIVYRLFAQFMHQIPQDDVRAAELITIADSIEATTASKDAMSKNNISNMTDKALEEASVIREKESNKIRTRLRARNAKQIRFLLGGTSIVAFLSLIVLTTCLVLTVLKNNNLRLDLYRLSDLSVIETEQMLSVRRLRQLQDAYAANNQTLFNSIQSNFYNEMQELKAEAWESFAIRETANATFNAFFVQPKMTVNYSYFPLETQGTVKIQVDFYKYLRDYGNSGMAVASLPFAAFGGNLTADNDFRMILDNWAGSFNIFDTYRGYLQDAIARDVTLTSYYVFYFSVAQVVIYILFVLILDRKFMGQFVQKQQSLLEVFRNIPPEAKQDLFDNAQMHFEEEGMILEDAIANVSVDVKERSSAIFRYQSFAYGLSTITLAIILALVTITDLRNLRTSLNVITGIINLPIETMRNQIAIGELSRLDYATWGSYNNILSAVSVTADRARSQYMTVLYSGIVNSATGMNVNDLLNSNVTTCVTFDNNACFTREYNATIGYVADRMTHGLLTIQRQVTNLLQGFSYAAKQGSINLDPLALQLVDKMVEPDLLDGFHILELQLDGYISEYFQSTLTRAIVLYIASVIIVLLGQFYVFNRYINYIKYLDLCNIELLILLPSEARMIPEVGEFVNRLATEGSDGRRASDVINMKNALKHKNKKKDDDDEESSVADIIAATRASVNRERRQSLGSLLQDDTMSVRKMIINKQQDSDTLSLRRPSLFTGDGDTVSLRKQSLFKDSDAVSIRGNKIKEDLMKLDERDETPHPKKPDQTSPLPPPRKGPLQKLHLLPPQKTGIVNEGLSPVVEIDMESRVQSMVKRNSWTLASALGVPEDRIKLAAEFAARRDSLEPAHESKGSLLEGRSSVTESRKSMPLEIKTSITDKSKGDSLEQMRYSEGKRSTGGRSSGRRTSSVEPRLDLLDITEVLSPRDSITSPTSLQDEIRRRSVSVTHRRKLSNKSSIFEEMKDKQSFRKEGDTPGILDRPTPATFESPIPSIQVDLDSDIVSARPSDPKTPKDSVEPPKLPKDNPDSPKSLKRDSLK